MTKLLPYYLKRLVLAAMLLHVCRSDFLHLGYLRFDGGVFFSFFPSAWNIIFHSRI